MARPSFLDDATNAKKVAEAFVDGATREQMCKAFGVSDKYTITRWRRDPRVKAHMHKLIEDRVLGIASKVDSRIAALLQNPENLSVKDLLDIRKEFLGGKHRDTVEGKTDADTVADAMDKLNDPKVYAALQAALANDDQPEEPTELRDSPAVQRANAQITGG